MTSAWFLVPVALAGAWLLWEFAHWPSCEEIARRQLSRDLRAWDAEVRADFRRAMRRHA